MRFVSIGALATAIAIGAIVVSGGGGGGTANIWVNTTAGGTPTRSGTLVAYDATKAYGTLVAACTAASSGDSIRIKSGTYNTSEALDTVCPNPTTITCEGTPSASPCTFTHALSISSATNVTLDGLTITTQAVTTSAAALVIGFGASPDNGITVKNSLVYSLKSGSTACTGGTVCVNGVLFVSGGSNITIGPNVTVTGCCSSDGVDVYYGSGTPTNFHFTRSTINGVYDTCANVPAATIAQLGSCTGYGIGDGCSNTNCEHDDGLALGSCITCTIDYNQLWNAGAQAMFAKTFGGGPITSLHFNSNMVDGNGAPTSGSGGVNIGSSCTPNCYTGTNQFLYNTLVGVSMNFYTLNDDGAQSWATGSTVQVTGNIAVNTSGYGIATVNGTGSHVAGCGGNGSNATFTFSYDWSYGGDCTGTANADIATKTVNLVHPNSYLYDLHLSGGTNDPRGAGESVFCGPATAVTLDVDGTVRTAPCDLGAAKG